MVQRTFGVMNNESLLAIPLFVFMGYLVERAALIERLFKSIPKVRIMSPPTNCLSPIGDALILDGLKKAVPDGEFYTSVTRSPAVYRGNPFQIETGLAYGGKIPADELADLWRFANRVPLQVYAPAGPEQRFKAPPAPKKKP